MPNVRIQPSIEAQWHDLVCDAQSIYGRQLGEELEHYLVLLLQRFCEQPQVLASVLATEYLRAFEQGGSWQQDSLRDVGDKCLLFSGLFPLQADQRRVSINYFVDLGKSSYYSVAEGLAHQKKMAQLFAKLERHFVGMMDVLHVIREMSGVEHQLPLMQALALWEHTQSDYARAVIDRHTARYIKKS